MPAVSKVDWYYHRSGCTSCKRVREFFDRSGIEPGEVQSAGGKTKIGADEALELARGAATLVVARGQKIVEFDMAGDPPGEEELRAAILGRSGTLRAPAVRAGRTLLIGYNAELHPQYL